ncbi:isoleucine--tRNA ligase-like [Zophobas morio]|uniref:isoleucine--tRNA ligase-like n=1 Tax=Zophobas morio TaxID=2755281 RepID=UPI0030836B55
MWYLGNFGRWDINNLKKIHYHLIYINYNKLIILRKKSYDSGNKASLAHHLVKKLKGTIDATTFDSSNNSTNLIETSDKSKENNYKFSDTLLLPKTTFSQRAFASVRELEIQDASFKTLYSWQYNRTNVKGTFVLQDGPPFANGDVHLGHAVNKILKDFIVRRKILEGYRVSYIPGWDCHGLPIEIKALQNSEEDAPRDPLQIRRKARSFAQDAVALQKAAFRRWGVIADWDNAYETMNNEYEASQVIAFTEMFEKGHIYQDYKPVYWSPSSRTALAEAELEYVDQHESDSVYVKFPIRCAKDTFLAGLPGDIQNSDIQASLLVWTTTPWTLPGNVALCVNPSASYAIALVAFASRPCKEVWVFMKAQIFDLSRLFASLPSTSRGQCSHGLAAEVSEFVVIGEILGKALVGTTCCHPIFKERESVVLSADHVSSYTGTGIVHANPAHGLEDFYVCTTPDLEGKVLVNDVSSVCYVDDAGKFTDFDSRFSGLDIFKEGTQNIIGMLSGEGLLVKHEIHLHRYPYDWRTKKPVILRSTLQWFCRIGGPLLARALQGIETLLMIPETSKNRLHSMLSARKDWCLSRQRVWGVPIPVFYKNNDKRQPVISRDISQHVAGLFRAHGSDIWWSAEHDDALLPPSRRKEGLIRGTDIMDVWFDSGTSWNAVTESATGSHVADLCVEGSDQHRGWFQSSLLTSVALRGALPFKTILTHGFVLDSEGKKMSKSLGNVVSPNNIINGNPNKNKEAAYGADVLRFWVASSCFTSDLYAGKESFAKSSENVRKLRTSARFLIGVLHDFCIRLHGVSQSNMLTIDRYIMARLHAFQEELNLHYSSYRFQCVVFRMLTFTSYLSSFYFTLLKDRLYAARADGPERRSAQTVLFYCLEVFTEALAPILPHLVEDIYKHAPRPHGKETKASVLMKDWTALPAPTPDREKLLVAGSIIEKLRPLINEKRLASLKNITSNEQLEIRIALSHALKPFLDEFEGKKDELKEALGGASVELSFGLSGSCKTDSLEVELLSGEKLLYSTNISVEKTRMNKCPRCWLYQSTNPKCLCPRCREVLNKKPAP